MNESETNEISRRRYPGLRSFDVNQQDIYYGRTKETADLFDLTKIATATLLYSRSGLGKSSLLNAGLLPKLQEAGYWPIRIRFQKQNQVDNTFVQLDEQPVAPDSPIKIVLDTLRAEFEMAYKAVEARLSRETSDLLVAHKQDDTLLLGNVQFVEGKYLTTQPILFDNESPRLWEYVKSHPFPHAIGIALLFDQFEEFFAYTIPQREEFLLQLGELVHDRPPTRVINWMMTATSDEPTPEQMKWGSQPSVKCVFAIRSDRLFEMDGLKQFIPLVFRNRYELPPLQEKAAREAIRIPASQAGNFDTPTFSYEDETLSLIISSLQDKNKEIDSSQLQMVCSYIENQSFTGILDNTIDKRLIPDDQKIKDIIEEYYNRQLKTLENEADTQLAAYVLEEYFVAKGQRIGIEEPLLITYLENRSEIIDQLRNARLIRAETTTRNTFAYELSHDKLIEPIEKARRKRDLDSYYSRRLDFLQNSNDKELASHLLESYFVDSGQRVSLSESNLKNLLIDRIDLIQNLVNARLIHPTNTQFGITYALEHDMLIKPIEKARKQRREKDDREKLEQDYKKEKLGREKERSGRLRLIYLLFVLILAILALLYAFSAMNKSRKTNLLLIKTATSALATQQYDLGKQYAAYRLWQRLDPTLLQDQSLLFVPFSGLNTKVDPTDQMLRYVSTIYRDNSFEVWHQTRSASYEKIIDKSVQASTSFDLKNERLLLAEGDSLIQVIDLPTRKRIFPANNKRYRLLTPYIQNIDKPDPRNLIIPTPKPILSPKGNWLVTVDSTDKTHLYNLNLGGKEHSFFRNIINSIPRPGLFSANQLVFSATDEFLLVRDQGQLNYYLFDLRTESRPVIYENIFKAAFSPMGQYITIRTLAGELTIIDLINGRELYSKLLDPMIVIDPVFTNQDSSLVIARYQQPLSNNRSKRATTEITFTISTINLKDSRPALKPLARDVSNYKIFGWAGHIVATNKNRTESYNYTVATGAKVICPFQRFSAPVSGKIYMIYIRPDVLVDKNLYLYSVLRNRWVKVTRLAGNEAKMAFYAPPNGPDETLISATSEKLIMVNLMASAKASKSFLYEEFLAKGKAFLPKSLNVTGSLIKVSRQDGMTYCFLPGYRQNRLDYIENSIYPNLTKLDEKQLGLSN